MKTNIITHTDGKGKSTEEIATVIIGRLAIGFSSLIYYPEDPFNGELRAYFDGSGFGDGAWCVEAYDHICGDRLWLREFKQGLLELGLSIKAVQNIKYNELSKQGKDYVSLIIGPTFYASWKRVNNKKGL
jgi:hypothetical protein